MSTDEMPKNPYGGGPSTGLQFPDYYRPTPSVRSRNNYFPGSETLGPDEMRISFVGSCPFPPRRNQAGTCIMVELGNGKRFFFDFGPGCVKNILAMGVPVPDINDIFITHLHVDHYHDLSYLLPFSAWAGRWTMPLRVTGPSGRTPELGTKGMVAGMKQMLKWHLEAFDACPIGDGYEVEVNEFDWKDENGVCYDQDGVVIHHWRRSHVKDGASAYRLDWNGLSFVWTGDGRPDELTVKYSQNVDVFVTETQPDLARINQLKYGLPEFLFNYTVDIHHTLTYATGYMIKQVNPRCGMVTHLAFDNDTLNETSAGVRAHWDGLFLYGAPDVVVVNVTKDAIWHREAALPGFSGQSLPSPTLLFGDPLPIATGKGIVPQPRLPREEQQEQLTRDIEVDPRKYYPPDVYREPLTKLPDPQEVDLIEMAKVMNIDLSKFIKKPMDLIAGGGAVPITILTGFLGAGKTTLLNRILSGDHGLRVGVLVNDFGAINIDAELVVGASDNMVSLANGCVCCQIRDDLIESILDLLARPEAIEYVVLEASGVADPAGIFMTFSDAGLRDRIRLDSVTCVVDAEQVFAHPEYPPLMELKLRQIGFADMLILNKVGLAGREQVAKVRTWLDKHFNRLRIVETDFCEAPYQILLGVGRFDPARGGAAKHARADTACEDEHHGHDHAEVFSTCSYETDRPLAAEAVRETMRKLPGAVYRVKGVLRLAEAPQRRAVLQVVGRRVDISIEDEWGERPPRTRVVAIGAAGAYDAALLEAAISGCVAS